MSYRRTGLAARLASVCADWDFCVAGDAAFGGARDGGGDSAGADDSGDDADRAKEFIQQSRETWRGCCGCEVGG